MNSKYRMRRIQSAHATMGRGDPYKICIKRGFSVEKYIVRIYRKNRE